MEQYWIVENNKINTETRDALNDFLLSMKFANRSERTIDSYRMFLERVFADITKVLNEVTADDIRSYINDNFIKLKESTVQRYISILSSFSKFCLAEEYINKTFVKSRWRPRLPKPVPKYLDKTEVAKLRQEAEKSDIRDRAILELLLSSGCRVGELQKLSVYDLDLENRTAKVLGKGKKQRNIHFSETCAILLEKYLEDHPNNVQALFLSKYHSRISIRAIQMFIKELGSKANLKREITPHFCRHTFASYLLSQGADLQFISEELGHSSLDTTRIYANLPKEEILSLYRKYM